MRLHDHAENAAVGSVCSSAVAVWDALDPTTVWIAKIIATFVITSALNALGKFIVHVWQRRRRISHDVFDDDPAPPTAQHHPRRHYNSNAPKD